MILLLILFPAFISGIEIKDLTNCSITSIGYPHQPAIFDKNGYSLLYPNEENTREIVVAQGSDILIGCPGSLLNTGVAFETAKCLTGNIFLINGTFYDLNRLECTSKIRGEARFTNNQCELMGREIEIGLQLPESFRRFIRICFDDNQGNTLYSHFNMTSYIGDHEAIPSPDFKTDDFYNFPSANSLYKVDHQRITINNLLGLPQNDTTYIQENSELHFSRGHLTAKSDFVYGFEQELTFHLVNAAPQWQTFNGGNWQEIEDSVRKLANERDWSFSIYTGTYGTSTLKNIEDVETPLYLYVKGDERGLPVPMLYWKVIHHMETGRAVAILGVNNAFANDFEPYTICEDVSQRLQWLKFDKKRTEIGYIYACEVNQTFRTIIKQLPDFTVSGLLI